MVYAANTVYTVSYDSESHFQVLTQLWGSKWPQVLPFCLGNVALMLVVTFMDAHYGETYIEMTPQGHTFIAVVVSFLLISRVNTALGRYNQARTHLANMCRETRQLVQYAFVYTADRQDDKAKEWRAELSHRALILLRAAMAVIDYPTTKRPASDIPGLEETEIKYLKQARNRNTKGRSSRKINLSPRVIEMLDEAEKNMRVPIQISYLLKKTIHSQGKKLQKPMEYVLENKLMASVDGFLSGYYGMRQFMTTPVPFPLVQMSRTFLFAYVFTIPFAMVGDRSSVLAHCFVVFLLTFGFVGLELVAIEMDNPFGEDDNDFNNGALAEVACEDTYMTVADVDGAEWANKLRRRMYDPKSKTQSPPDEQSRLLVEDV
eukprot:CAMPEP_0183711598 /NCGR_PEP_ID=MMETSP0737-20130205/7070_1 /TAXON_ID=385413 /ORGANISM="Thalassiosira miniscula, Strain CCMP1093" /LENGTH=374 /DNA_ID=CAMNT_0025940155 /DNA_START=113 /DNA_END=1237 /DNA_ORIENTATION=+